MSKLVIEIERGGGGERGREKRKEKFEGFET